MAANAQTPGNIRKRRACFVNASGFFPHLHCHGLWPPPLLSPDHASPSSSSFLSHRRAGCKPFWCRLILHIRVFPKPHGSRREWHCGCDIDPPAHRFSTAARTDEPFVSPALALRLRSPCPLLTYRAFLFFFYFFLFGSVFEARFLTRMWRARLCPMRTSCIQIFLRSPIHICWPGGGGGRLLVLARCRACALPSQRSAALALTALACTVPAQKSPRQVDTARWCRAVARDSCAPTGSETGRIWRVRAQAPFWSRQRRSGAAKRAWRGLTPARCASVFERACASPTVFFVLFFLLGHSWENIWRIDTLWPPRYI